MRPGPVAAFLLLLAVVTVAVLLRFSARERDDAAGGIVFDVPRTGTYHAAVCPRLAMARAVRMTITEARSRGELPCPKCRLLLVGAR